MTHIPKSKIVTIHQPETFPWLGFFNKMMLADEYLILDSVQFRKNYFQNRNQFLTNQGARYLSIPIDFKNYKLIKDIRIKYNDKWQLKHLNTIKQNYGKSTHFDKYVDFFEKLYSTNFELLIDFNMSIINFVREALEITTPLLRSSEMTSQGASGELLLNLCKERNASTYLSGRDGRNYLDVDIFDAAQIEVVYHDFTHPAYNQFNSKEFVPFMNIFDLLLNHSVEKSKQIILSGDTLCAK